MTSNKPRLLDLFCGAGGAAMGYYRAGFEVVGIDIESQPHYPFEFIQADALEYLSVHGSEFDAIHASPPCQGYSSLKNLIKDNHYPLLIEPIRDLLKQNERPYIIENVPGAPLINPTLLCGLMFGLELYRHRFFESSFELPFLMDYGHGRELDKLKGKRRKRDIVLVCGHSQYRGYKQRAQDGMGIDWMDVEELAEAVPPAYTEFIGRHLMRLFK